MFMFLSVGQIIELWCLDGESFLIGAIFRFVELAQLKCTQELATPPQNLAKYLTRETLT